VIGACHQLFRIEKSFRLPRKERLRRLLVQAHVTKGHSSTRAALIYLHSTDERQREIADALGDLAAGELKRKASRARKGTAGSRSGTQRAQRRKSAS
jgi:hypothetical protein